MISNITAGNVNQIQSVIDEGLVPLIVDIIAKGDFKSQKEAVWVITNLTSGGTPEQIAYCIQAGVLAPLCDMLSAKESKVAIVILEGLMNILTTAEKFGQAESICVMIEECGGLDKIEQMQSHENEQVYNAALRLIEKYFSDEEETLGVAPETSEQGNFEFNASAPSSGFEF